MLWRKKHGKRIVLDRYTREDITENTFEERPERG